MLNELLSIMNALNQSGESLTEHPHVQDYSPKDGFTVIVGKNGSLKIKSIGTNQNKWRYFPHNQLSFPASKVFGPLIQPESLPQLFIEKYKDFIIRKSKERKKDVVQELENAVFEEFISIIKDDKFSYEVTNDPQILKKFEKSWTSAALLVSEQFGEKLAKVEPMCRLVDTLKESATQDLQSIREKVSRFIVALVKAVHKVPNGTEMALKLFLGKYNKTTDSWDKGEEVSIYFEDSDEEIEFSRDDFRKLLVQVESEQSGKDLENLPRCALTGKPQPPVEDTFPQVKVPVFQQKTALLAMNKDVFCHDRYGKIAADICPVGSQTAQQMAEALRFITSEPNKDKTWRRIISDKENKSDLLIVYYEPKPVNDAELAGHLDDYQDVEYDDVAGYKDFADRTKAVISLLDSRIYDIIKDNTIKCLILRELDPGRRQLLYSDSFTVDDLQNSAEFWQKGSTENVPKLKFWIFKDKKSSERIEVGLKPISFKNAQELFQIKWIRGGAESCRTPGVSRGDIFALFLHRDSSSQAGDLLRRLLDNCYNLFVFVGAKYHLGKEHYKDISNEQRKRTLHCLEMIGVLLKNLDSEKEVYMNQTAYNLGRLLALADKLHIFYCQDLRSGDVPMSLIGNALLPVAKTNPSQALSRLFDRLQIYMGWAKKYSNSKTSEEKLKAANKPAPRLVAWVMKELNRVSNAITESDDLPKRKLSDIEAAQLLLGYLAPYKGKDSPDSEDEQNETAESEK